MKCPKCNSDNFYVYQEVIHINRIPFNKDGSVKKLNKWTLSRGNDVRIDYLRCPDCESSYDYTLDDKGKVNWYDEFR